MFFFDWNGYIGHWELFIKEMKKNIKKIIVISPHPDDETLGCGGTLLNTNQQEIIYIG